MRNSLLVGTIMIAISAAAILAQRGGADGSGSVQSPSPQVLPLAQRIAHADPAKYRPSPSVHAGAGQLDYMALFNQDTLDTNLFFLHRGIIEPKSGIGGHTAFLVNDFVDPTR